MGRSSKANMRQMGGYRWWSFQFVQQAFWRWLLSAIQQASRILESGKGQSIVKERSNKNCFQRPTTQEQESSAHHKSASRKDCGTAQRRFMIQHTHHYRLSITGDYGQSYRLVQLRYIRKISNQSNDCWYWNNHLHWWRFWNGFVLTFSCDIL